MLIKKIKNTVTRYSMLSHGDRIVVAVSGGPDSICLLNALHAMSAEFNLSLHVAHLDHMFRGSQSAEEALFVAKQAKKLGLPCTIEKKDVPAFCRLRGVSAQAGAREIRYEFLSRVASEMKAARIATGHTSTDQAETFLLRLIRGAGLSGLSGIPARRENIIRPLITATREEILDYLRMNDMEFVTDPSNAKPVYARNRIRNELLPVLRRFNPRIVETLATAAQLIREEDEAAERHLTDLAAGIMEQQGEAIVLKRGRFNSLPPVYRRRLLRKSIERAGHNPVRLSSIQIDEALAFMTTAQTGRVLRLFHGLQLAREYDLLIVRPESGSKAYFRDIVVPGITVIPELDLALETAILDSSQSAADDSDSADQENYFWQARFDYDKIARKITARNRMPGDWFCPAGMAGRRKKLQDFFVDSKVPRSVRDSVLLVTAGDDIIWVAGLRLDERSRPGPDTRKILAIRVRKS